MKWTISLPFDEVAEDDKESVQVEADTIEEAIRKANAELYGPSAKPTIGQVFNVHARVEVVKPSSLPLRSV